MPRKAKPDTAEDAPEGLLEATPVEDMSFCAVHGHVDPEMRWPWPDGTVQCLLCVRALFKVNHIEAMTTKSKSRIMQIQQFRPEERELLARSGFDTPEKLAAVSPVALATLLNRSKAEVEYILKTMQRRTRVTERLA